MTSIGCRREEIDTPALCVDLDAFEWNVAAMAEKCRQQGVAWRPHAKCHKSSEVARRLVNAGAVGATCAKLGEAEVLAAGGIRDLLIANMLVGPSKMERLVALRRVADPIVCVDHIEQARPISEAMHRAGLSIRMLMEIDIGMQRVGVSPLAPALELARAVSQMPGITFSGIMGYEGHLLLIDDAREKKQRIWEALDKLGGTQSLLKENGIPCPIVSCGGTGSLEFSASHPAATEIQAGGGIFMDEFYRARCRVPHLKTALTVLATVVSRPTVDRAIVDAGRKSMNQELAPARVLHHADIEIAFLSAEHGALKLSANSPQLRIGELVEFSPGYSDFTTVLHDRFVVLRDGKVVDFWNLEARGKLS